MSREVKLTFNIERDGDSWRAVVRREGEEGPGWSPFPEIKGEPRRKRDDPLNPILDWRALIGLTPRSSRGETARCALPLLVFLGAYRKRAGAKENKAWVPISRIEHHFPEVRQKRSTLSSFLQGWYNRANRSSLLIDFQNQPPTDEGESTDSQINGFATTPDQGPHLAEITPTALPSTKEAATGWIKLLPFVEVSFSAPLGINPNLAAEEFAVAWLHAMARKIPEIAEKLGIRQVTTTFRVKGTVQVEVLTTDLDTGPPEAPSNTVVDFRVKGTRGLAIQPLADFYGRKNELESLRSACVAASGSPYVVVAGMPGVGKTSLAQKFVATEAGSLFADIAWIDAAKDLVSELAHFAQQFGMEDTKSHSSPEMVVRWLSQTLRSRNMLLVLDSVPQNVDPKLIPIPGSQSRVVMTTRSATLGNKLNVRVALIEITPWDEETARTYMRSVLPALEASDADLERLACIVEGLPLALRSIALLLGKPGVTAPALLGRFQQDPLAEFERVENEIERGVGKVVSAAFEELDRIEQQVLVACAVCARQTTTEYVAAAAGVAPEDALHALGNLAQRSLVKYYKDDFRLWGLHEVVRLFAEHQVNTPAARERHLDFLRSRNRRTTEQDGLSFSSANVLERLSSESQSLDDLEEFQGIRRERRKPNLIFHPVRSRPMTEEDGRSFTIVVEDLPELLADAAHALATNDTTLAVELLSIGVNTWARAGRGVLFLPLLQDLRRGNSPELRYAANRFLGECYYNIQDFNQAIVHYRNALNFSRKLGNQKDECQQLLDLAVCHQSSDGGIDSLLVERELLIEAEELSHTLGWATMQADLTLRLGINALRIGTEFSGVPRADLFLNQAQTLLMVAEEFYSEEFLGGAQFPDVTAFVNECITDTGALDQTRLNAINLLQRPEFLQFQRQVEANATSRPAMLHKRAYYFECMASGNMDDAIGGLYMQALSLVDYGDLGSASEIYADLGKLYYRHGQFLDSIVFFERALNLQWKLAYLRGQAESCLFLGRCYVGLASAQPSVSERLCPSDELRLSFSLSTLEIASQRTKVLQSWNRRALRELTIAPEEQGSIIPLVPQEVRANNVISPPDITAYRRNRKPQRGAVRTDSRNEGTPFDRVVKAITYASHAIELLRAADCGEEHPALQRAMVLLSELRDAGLSLKAKGIADKP